MNVPWDQILVYLIVAGALAYLARAYTGKGKKGGCGGCSNSCGPSPAQEREPKAAIPLIQLDAAPPRRNGQPQR
jgi:hypothetical protein